MPSVTNLQIALTPQEIFFKFRFYNVIFSEFYITVWSFSLMFLWVCGFAINLLWFVTGV